MKCRCVVLLLDAGFGKERGGSRSCNAIGDRGQPLFVCLFVFSTVLRGLCCVRLG